MSTKIILMVGVPGSGKTFLAKSLSEKFNCEILNRALIRSSIFPKKYIDHSKSIPSHTYSSNDSI